jgi:hypothetical protein
MADIPKLNYSTRITNGGWDDVPEGKTRVMVSLVEGDKVIFEDLIEGGEGQTVIDTFVKAQGWPTIAEHWKQYPLRYKMWVDEDPRDWDSTFCDQVCTDRVTGQEVFRYDLGDPANYNPEYGGYSDTERFERRGLKRSERVCVDDCVVKD